MVAFWNLPSPSQNDQYYFEAPVKALDCYSSYDRIVLIEGFNPEDQETCIRFFFTNTILQILSKKVRVSKILQNLPPLIYF